MDAEGRIESVEQDLGFVVDTAYASLEGFRERLLDEDVLDVLLDAEDIAVEMYMAEQLEVLLRDDGPHDLGEWVARLTEIAEDAERALMNSVPFDGLTATIYSGLFEWATAIAKYKAQVRLTRHCREWVALLRGEVEA